MFRVLLVEDNEAVRLVLGKQLKHEGIDVTPVETGDDAVLIAQECQDFDVAILDCVLPGRIDGMDLVFALRQACPGIGVVRMSGHSLQAVDYESDNDFDVFLTKPVRRRELIDAVNFAYQAHSILKRRAG